MVKRLAILAVCVLLASFALPAVSPYKTAEYISEKRAAFAVAASARAIVGDRLLGEEFTETTTTVGHKDAKLLSQAPDFPALLVQWLCEAGVREGDAVAINASGSFPALVIASLAAVEAVKAKPLLISSLGASSWGANRPGYSWAHMERELCRHWPGWKSIAMSLGGEEDRAVGMPEEGRQALIQARALAAVPELTPQDGDDAVQLRLRFWREANGGELPALLINVGGNQAFWGSSERDAPTTEGLLLPGRSGPYGDGVGKYFAQAGKPVIHLLGIKKIAALYGISLTPDESSELWRLPEPSRGARMLAFCFVLGVLVFLPRLSGVRE